MKKILLIIILFFGFYKHTSAETFYGEYFKVDDISNIESDLVKIETYNVYNTYNKELIDMGYMYDNNTYIKDESDYIYEEYYDENYNDNDILIKINTSINELQYINIGNLSHNLKIYEIEVLINGIKTNYEIANFTNYKSYNMLDILNIMDNDLDTYYINDDKYNSFIIMLGLDKKYKSDSIEIKIYTKKDEKGYFEVSTDKNTLIEIDNKIDKIINIKFYTSDIKKDPEYLYKNLRKIYKYYKENIIVLNEYKRSGENLILEDYKTIDEYYKRNKLILKDKLVIDNNDNKIEDLITYSSDEIKIESNINYEKNGIYKCKFILKGLEVEKDITVNIENINKKDLNNILSKEEKPIEKVETPLDKEDLTNRDSTNNNFTTTKQTTSRTTKLITTKNIKTTKIITTEKQKTTTKTTSIMPVKTKNKGKTKRIKTTVNITTTKEKKITTKNNETKTKIKNKRYKKMIKLLIIIVLIIFDIICIIKKKWK